MCGIAGIYAYHDAAAPAEPAELLAIRDHMSARGPDGAGEWWSADRRLALAHRRLAIIDLSELGAQPMASRDGRYHVSFNGEIYNHPELRRELEADGVVYVSGSDTETLLHLYARDGAAMLKQLRGMFTLAIWDTQAQTLFLARDPYGIKPLYYANDGWTMRFASQVKALLAGGKISSEPEPAGVVGFKLWGHVPEPFTLYREIRALPAGHCMWVDRWGPRVPERYHHVAEVYSQASRQNHSAKVDREGVIRAAVRDSIRAHLLADVEVGVFLSAGIDSGAILGVVSEFAARRPRAITLSFEEFRGSAEDEAPLAADVARLYGAEHLVRHVGQTEFNADLPALLDAMDQPSIDGVNTWFVSKAAREVGLKVALSGLGGDELLAGYPSFIDVPRWHRRFGPVAGVPGVGLLAQRILPLLFPGLLRKQPKSAFMLRYAATWEGSYLLKRGLFLPDELHQQLDADLLREGLRRLQPLSRLRASLTPDPASDNARVAALESCHYMRDQLLRDSDWAGMAHSLEIRTPLVDSHLLGRLAPIVGALQPGEGKRALAQTPSVALPASVADRAKTGFGVPTGAWLASALEKSSGSAGLSKGQASRGWSGFVLDRQSPVVGTA